LPHSFVKAEAPLPQTTTPPPTLAVRVCALALSTERLGDFLVET